MGKLGMKNSKFILLFVMVVVLSIPLSSNGAYENESSRLVASSLADENEADFQPDSDEQPSSRITKSIPTLVSPSPIIFTTARTQEATVLSTEGTPLNESELPSSEEISDTLTVSFKGTGSGVEDCSGEWGYQRVSFNVAVDIEVVAINPSQADGIVIYELSSKTGTVHFYGTAEDVFNGETTIKKFDRTQNLDLKDIEGILKYSTSQCSDLYIGFQIPASTTLPDTVYVQYDGALGIIRNTVNMPYPWDVESGCIQNNYDVLGQDDFDYCDIDLQIDTAPLQSGGTTNVHASPCLPIDPDLPLTWKIEPIGDDEVKATITSDGHLGETAAVTDVDGEGRLLITVSNPSFPDCSEQVILSVGNDANSQTGDEQSFSSMTRSADREPTTSPIILTNSLAEKATVISAGETPSEVGALFAPAEISDTLTVSFQGTGSGMESCSGDWGYQRITYNMEVDIEVVAENPSQADGTVTYDLSRKTGTIHFYGTVEDVFYGETTIENFDRTQNIDLQNLEGTLQYSTGQCSNLYIGFSVPASASLPYSIYIQYDGALGIVRNTVNMPYPWNAGVGCLGNNYDVPGKDDFDYCNIDLKIDKASLPPGDTTKIHASSCLPIDPAQPLVWEIKPLAECETKAKITSDGGLGETATITEVEGEGYVLITVTNPAFPDCTKTAALLIGCGCGITSDKCVLPGNGILELSSIIARFNLGRTDRGDSAGDIFLTANVPDPANATPQILKVYSFGNNLEKLSNNNGLRQIVAPDAFVDITVIDAFSYTMAFYDRADVGGKVSGFYSVIPGATANVIWTVENPDASATVYDRLRLTENKNGLTRISEYRWDAATNAWILSKGNGLQIATRKEETSGGNRIVTETIEDAANITASKVRTTYSQIPYNGQTAEEIVEIVEDPEGDALTTTRSWYQDPCAAGSCGRLASQLNPDGSWVSYEYDALGRKILEIRSWLDAPVGSSAESARAIHYDYTAQHADDSQAPEDARLPRKVTENVLGNEVSTTFYVHTNNSDSSRTEIVERTGTQGAAYGAAGNLRTTTEYYPFSDTSPDSWRVKSIVHPDRTRDAYTYQYGTYTPNSDPTQLGTFTAGTGTDIQEQIVHGTVADPMGIAFKTTGERYVRNALGDVLLNRTYVYAGSGYYWTIDWTVRTYDGFGHILMESHSNGTRMDNTWDCCGKASETDRQGIVRSFSYDDLGRMETQTKDAADPMVSTDTYDAAGRRLTQSIGAGGLSQSSSSVYDLSGRLTQSTDASGLVTGYNHTAGGRITTVTRPGGATEITERYLDGRVKSITGTGVVPRYYTYGANADGTRWTRIDTGTPSSPMWETTTVDLLGRTIKVEKPGYDSIETTIHTYNDMGQLIKIAATGLADTLYAYDDIGNQIQSGLDVDGNGALELASMDRITETRTVYVEYGSDCWQESVQKVYAEDNDGTPTVVGTNRSRLTGLGAGGLIAETVSINIHGNQTVSTEAINRGIKTVTRTIDYPVSTMDAVSVSANGLLTTSTSKTGVTTTYSYDPLERQTGVTDPRSGTTITHYNAQGWVDFIKDPAGHQTTYTYDPNTGRKIAETNALSKAVRFAYNDRGQLLRTWGDAVYPVEYVYDTYGRMSEIHTWRTDEGWSGATWPSGAAGSADHTFWHYQAGTGLLTGKEDADGKIVTYTYGDAGRLASRTWARTDSGSPLVTAYAYDPNTGELITIDYSDTTPDIAFTYDRLGRLKSVTDAVGNRTLDYNTGLQPETETITGLYNRTITRAYDAGGVIGRPTGFNIGSDYAINYDYDITGRLNTVGWNVDGISHAATYSHLPDSDLLGQMTTDDGLQTTYTYEPQRDLRTRIENRFNGTLISQYDYAYDALGRRESVVNSGQAFNATNPGFNLYEYNNRNEVIESDRYMGSNLSDLSNPVTTEYRAYTFDPIGNRIDNTEGVDAGTYTTNSLNQYTQQSPPQGGTCDFTYDDDGNMTAVTDGRGTTQYSYNGENRLVAVQPAFPADGDKKLEFTYDYMGRRVLKKVDVWQTGTWVPLSDTLFLYDGWNIVSEWPAGSAPSDAKYYAWGLDVSQTMQGAGGAGGLIASFSSLVGDLDKDGDIDGSDLAQLAGDPGLLDMGVFASKFGFAGSSSISSLYGSYYFYDSNGNVGQFINGTDSEILSHYEYDSYGNSIAAYSVMADINPYQFSTKYYDAEFGLYYYGYRYYSPELGRWVKRDPIEERGGINLYGFVGNDGVNGIDLFGLSKHNFQQGLKWLKDICEKIDKKIKKLNKNDCQCPIDVCKKQAEDIISDLTNQWVNNFGKDKQVGEEEGGYFCYQWADLFYRTLTEITLKDKPKCFSVSIGEASTKQRPKGWFYWVVFPPYLEYNPAHYWIKVSPYNSDKLDFRDSVYFDDGYDSGLTAHQGEPNPTRYTTIKYCDVLNLKKEDQISISN
jgi:RHS repeat-associated protein